MELRAGSLLEPLGDLVVDAIVSNPPYVTRSEWAMLDSGVTDFEPQDALVSGTDGMDHTRSLLEAAGTRLSPGGLIAIEVDSTRADTAVDLARRLGLVDGGEESAAELIRGYEIEALHLLAWHGNWYVLARSRESGKLIAMEPTPCCAASTGRVGLSTDKEGLA